ncbi:hypothetical protein [Streptomyces sp. NRRL B-1347]|nr:hypothetical protein [Streptomyces sp. NRRL B-1347]
MSERKHDPKRCTLCAPLRHPSQARTRRALREGSLTCQTRTNGENGGSK